MGIEKRRFERTSCEIEGTFRGLAGELMANLSETLVRDISEGGVRFRTNRFIPVNQKLVFKINVPNQRPIEVVAQPAWIREVPALSQYDIGAKFISLSDSDRRIIREFTQDMFQKAYVNCN